MGVKSLWTLLGPIGRPVMLETVEGKIMAIDSSIWLYQFQATMRDKEGRSLVNAHVLGFLRRILKLLFYGIKPVFVFDGGAPALKRTTLSERKKKKMGAASTHIKLAEKLLAAQMRREALNQAQNNRSKNSKGKNRQPDDVLLAEDTVYLEDIDGSAPRTPQKRKLPTPSSSNKKKSRDHDPYNLPHVDMDEVITKATRASAPDPRLATEEELRTFIEQMRPEDFDVNSPDFRELPTEIQYEIIGDLRLKSRQTSYARLQRMLKNAPTPLDFSKQQIKNLRQRNTLTQQLLMTTDSIGNANIAIPVRIASERNREYILMKNEGVDGGWILGIKDIGTRDKPIVLDHEDPSSEREDNDSDDDMEEVQVPNLKEDLVHRSEETALSATSHRRTQKVFPSSALQSSNRSSKSAAHLKGLEIEMDDNSPISDSEEDGMLAYAIQESLDQFQVRQTARQSKSSTSGVPNNLQQTGRSPRGEVNKKYTTHHRLETALSIANAGPSRVQSSSFNSSEGRSLFGQPTLLSPVRSTSPLPNEVYCSQTEDIGSTSVPSTENDQHLPIPSGPISRSRGGEASLPHVTVTSENPRAVQGSSIFGQPSLLTPIVSMPNQRETFMGSHDENLDQPQSSLAPQVDKLSVVSTLANINPKDDWVSISGSDEDMEEVPVEVPAVSSFAFHEADSISVQNADSPLRLSRGTGEHPEIPKETMNIHSTVNDEAFLSLSTRTRGMDDAESRSSSPRPSENDWDPVHEIDVNQEEGEFARFMSHVKGRNMDEVRQEIDAEINDLNQQRKNAMRDSDDITQQMIAQIMTMLRLFGIPYITAPMEAEAQCAELVSLELVDGVITDDSDVFLFGAQRVYKNMFNQSKTVECFLLSDLSRELGLDRDALIHLAYLLGSDYTEGLPGVGPVVAMELLKEFPGLSGLHHFKDWWVKVQSGKDRPEDSQSKFRKQFKKKFKNLYLADDWPNSVVRDAYYHPTVDSSEEPFKWGMPDLDGLRSFLRQELGWQKPKVDELLLPIIQRMNKRNQAAALNKQGNLNDFLEIAGGSGTYAPRQSQAYQSKRLQQVISDFRKRRRSASAVPDSQSPSPSGEGIHGEGSSGPSIVRPPPAKKRKPKANGTQRAKGKGKATMAKPESGTVEGRNTRAKGREKRKDRSSDGMAISDDNEDEDFIPLQEHEIIPAEVVAGIRPRPRPKPIAKGSQSTDKGEMDERNTDHYNSTET